MVDLHLLHVHYTGLLPDIRRACVAKAKFSNSFVEPVAATEANTDKWRPQAL